MPTTQNWGERERLAMDAHDGIYPRRAQRFLLIAAALVGAVGVGGAMAYTYKKITSHFPQPKMELNERVKTLTDALNSSTRIIAEIEHDISERVKLVDRLERDAAAAERLASINREQAEAIAQALQGQLQKREQESFWSSNLQALFWTIVGVVMAEVFHFLKRILSRASATKPPAVR